MEKLPEYQVSVITPFHNVDMDMFRRGYESLQRQSIGFDNIQWIVVLHNTKPEIRAEVEKMLAGQENIIIKVLDNDIHTPSSPRNYGLQLATAPYVGFLDGDDSFTPLCLQTTVDKMKKHACQMVVFRREYELEREGLFPLTEIVLWDQTKEEIIIERNNWDNIRMFSGIWGMVTSRLFDRKFLSESGITFDETVPYGEDILFIPNLSATIISSMAAPQCRAWKISRGKCLFPTRKVFVVFSMRPLGTVFILIICWLIFSPCSPGLW